MVKGKARPIDAVRVGSVIGSSALGTASGLPFLGRDPELELFSAPARPPRAAKDSTSRSSARPASANPAWSTRYGTGSVG